MKRATKNRIITIFILLTFLGSSVTYAIISAIPSGDTSSGWMAQLVILVPGYEQQGYPIPADIGYVGNQSTANVFTRSTDGILYKSTIDDVTIKDFFEVWGKTFNSTCILDYCNTNNSYVTMFVNKKINQQFENYVIQDRDQIIIYYK
jgi:hypothetical protein